MLSYPSGMNVSTRALTTLAMSGARTATSERPAEVWFSIVARQAIHRGTYRSVKDLNTKIRAFITGWNDRCHPFAWTKTADQILTKANRKKTSNAGH